MKVEFVPYHSLDQLLSRGIICNDFYQHPEYVQMDAALHNGEPFLFLASDENLQIAIPVIRRKINQSYFNTDLFDAASPYGYTGYIFNQQPDSASLKNLPEELRLCAAANKIISIFIRLHPFYNDHAFDNTDLITQVQHGPTIYVDLKYPLDQIRRQYSTNHKRGIKNLESAGFTIRINDKPLLPAFISAYRSTMQLVNAKNYYHFDEHYFEKLFQVFNENIFLITAHDGTGEFTSGAIFISTGKLVQYHLGGTAENMRRFAASKLVFDAAIQYFHGAEKNILHLGGGYGSAEDELFRFKSGFSKLQKRFSTLRIICDEQKYPALTINQSHQIKSNNNYFPAYRNE